MAIPTDTVWEVRSSGSDTTCGGGWSDANKGATGVDHSQSDTANATFTATLSGAGTTTLTDSGAGFNNTMLGNIVLITGQGSYCITGFTNSSTVTVDRNLGTFSNGTGYEGGAHATPGKVAGLMTTGNSVHVKQATYNMSSSNNVAGGNINLDIIACRWTGYNSSRNDDGARPVFAANANSMTVVTLSRASVVWRNIDIKGTSRTTITGLTLGAFSGSGNMYVYRCKVYDCDTKGVGMASASDCFLVGIEVTNCGGSSGGAVSGVSGRMYHMIGCDIHDNATGTWGVVIPGNIHARYCKFYRNLSVSSVVGVSVTAGNNSFDHCVFYGNGGSGIKTVGSTDSITNCIFESNGAYGIDDGGTAAALLVNNAFYNNTTAAVRTSGNFEFGSITGSGSFFSNAPTDLSINNTASAGALIRNAAYPSSYPDATVTNYSDVGSANRNASAGGLLRNPDLTGGMR